MRTVVGKVVGVLDGDGAKVYAQLSGQADEVIAVPAEEAPSPRALAPASSVADLSQIDASTAGADDATRRPDRARRRKSSAHSQATIAASQARAAKQAAWSRAQRERGDGAATPRAPDERPSTADVKLRPAPKREPPREPQPGDASKPSRWVNPPPIAEAAREPAPALGPADAASRRRALNSARSSRGEAHREKARAWRESRPEADDANAAPIDAAPPLGADAVRQRRAVTRERASRGEQHKSRHRTWELARPPLARREDAEAATVEL